MIQDYNLALSDAQTSILLDDKNIKGHLLTG